ncbi:subtilisin family serine protease/predicted nucleic acid-binding Zn-ribbon protein [Planomicrobium stackebrandtii]|uniref:Subtilisin family serine protease/predicted nucleic acid-binding Zn-ribbon protein n=1 Tax=Planomicrobium stackebrandtii TaxID=253160 RepID=A0ABU0GST3_9BACL|nr:S8 family serine peptidase [Planomicrobium stackebrandtii]MDQ0428416.1 subtilisin family serine protease/predicted nucleic acid-binding Zn-ribbon protein [Planomicrobium stackebrandtii]
MRRGMKISAALLSVVLLGNTLNTSVYAEGEEPIVTQAKETDQVIVTFKESVKSEQKDLDAVTVNTVDTDEIATLKVPEGETVDAFIEELEARKDIESVEPDHLVQLTYTPNDPYFNYYQYHHTNIETERAWDKTMGSSDVVVAVLDQGFDINHQDLANQIVSPHFTSDTGFSVDDHGTHVAGIIGSSIDNYAFGTGVAPQTSIMPIDVFEGETAYTSDVIEGIYQAVWSGADIINMSLGSYTYNTSYNNAIQYAYQSGLVIVASAGNDSSSQTRYPAAYDNVISVGSTDSSNYQSYFSNYGYDVDIVAPGSSIYSTLPYNSGGWMSGTSMAAPVVSGVAALVLANEPDLTNDEVVTRLLTTTKDLGAYGKDYYYGNGLVNARQALKIVDIPSPAVDEIQDNSTSISGYLSFEIDNGTVIVRDQAGTIISSQEGYSSYSYFEMEIPKQIAGTRLYVSVMDANGNESEATERVVVDATSPDKPIVQKVTDQSTSITGTAEANSELTILANDAIINTIQVNGNGHFESSIERLAAGTELVLYVMDDAGNISESTYTTVTDATPPAKPVVDKVIAGAVKVTGTAEAGSTVKVISKGVLLGEAVAASNGAYSIAVAKQQTGTALSVTATDSAGNVSSARETGVVDGTAPALSFENKVTHHSTRIIGTAEAASIVSVKNGSTTIGTATTDSKGSYEVNIKKQKVGTNLSITAMDADGNSSAAISVTVVDGNFPDLKVVHWALDEIMYLGDDQIIGGYPNGGFQPDKDTTRAEAAKMLALALDLPIEDVSSGYKDVPDKHWGKNYIAAVTKAGLFTGNPDGTFAPNDVLKRSEMAKVISIAYELDASDKNHFNDVKAGHWAKGYISGLYENGITTGFPDETFRPGASTTRAEYSVFLARAMNEDFR